MTISLKHAFTSAKADGTDSTLIQPSNWNAEHTLTLATSRLVGRTTAGAGAAEEISVNAPLSLSATALSHNTSGVVAGSYPKVTVDAYGHVTAGSALASTDVTTGLGYTPFNKAGDVISAAGAAAFTGTTASFVAIRDSGNTPNNHVSLDFGSSGSAAIPQARIAMQYTTGGSYLKFGTSNNYSLGITNTAMSLDMTGNLVAAANVTAYSDERLKTNWSNLPSDLIEQLALVKCGTYDRTDEVVRQVGVSAQSLQRVMPEAVLTDEQGMLSVAYGNAALAAAVELSKRILMLEDEIKALKAKACNCNCQ